MENLSKTVAETLIVVKEAAEFLQNPLEECSDGENPFTNIDILISDFLTRSLKKVVDVEVLSEEDVSIFKKPDDYFWLIDPIDGTMNFISGSPDVAISVALVDKDFNAIVSVVYLPFYDELFTATKNKGAYLNGERLGQTNSKLKIAAYGLPGDAPKRKESIVRALSLMIENNYVLRQSGSAVLDICYVSKGAWRAFFEEGLYVWDVAAANLIAQESGYQSFMSTQDKDFKCNYIVAEDEETLEEIKRFTDQTPTWDSAFKKA